MDSAYTWPNHVKVAIPAVRLKSDPNDTASEWMNPLWSEFGATYNGLQITLGPTVQMDPRTARWGVHDEGTLGEISSGTSGIAATALSAYLLEPTGNANALLNTTVSNTAMETSNFSVFATARPRADKGESTNYLNPGNPSGSGVALNAAMHLFSGKSFSNAASTTNPSEFDGLMAQNKSRLEVQCQG